MDGLMHGSASCRPLNVLSRVPDELREGGRGENYTDGLIAVKCFMMDDIELCMDVYYRVYTI